MMLVWESKCSFFIFALSGNLTSSDPRTVWKDSMLNSKSSRAVWILRLIGRYSGLFNISCYISSQKSFFERKNWTHDTVITIKRVSTRSWWTLICATQQCSPATKSASIPYDPAQRRSPTTVVSPNTSLNTFSVGISRFQVWIRTTVSTNKIEWLDLTYPRFKTPIKVP